MQSRVIAYIVVKGLNTFLDPEGSQSATTVVVVGVGVVVTVFEKCLKLC